MRTPASRGPLSATVREAIRSRFPVPVEPAIDSGADALADDDLQLALWMCYELHYRGFDDAEPDAEWNPDLLGFRALLEAPFRDSLLRRIQPAPAVDASQVPGELMRLTRDDGGPSLSRYLQREATREQFEEFVMHRSVYHLKEADPHSWAIPRLSGHAKAAMVEIQFDEYGSGRASRMHSELFRAAMRGLGLDDTYGAYVERAPGITLAQSNLISYFGLHQRWRGALAGHLGAFEMTSSAPNRRYAAGYRRVGGPDDGAAFYDEHVEADAVHEQIALHDLCGRLAQDDPRLAPQIVFGAAACLYLDGLFAAHLRTAWAGGGSSLARDPSAAPEKVPA